jgi:hypothetical protein
MLDVLHQRLPQMETHMALIEELRLERDFPLVMAPSSILDSAHRLRAAAGHARRGGHVAFELTNPHWLAAGAPLAGDTRSVRVLDFSRASAHIELDYETPAGVVTQDAAFALVWPEEMEAFLEPAQLQLARLWGIADAELDTSPVFYVLAARA